MQPPTRAKGRKKRRRGNRETVPTQHSGISTLGPPALPHPTPPTELLQSTAADRRAKGRSKLFLDCNLSTMSLRRWKGKNKDKTQSPSHQSSVIVGLSCSTCSFTPSVSVCCCSCHHYESRCDRLSLPFHENGSATHPSSKPKKESARSKHLQGQGCERNVFFCRADQDLPTTTI